MPLGDQSHMALLPMRMPVGAVLSTCFSASAQPSSPHYFPPTEAEVLTADKLCKTFSIEQFFVHLEFHSWCFFYNLVNFLRYIFSMKVTNCIFLT